MTKEEIVNKIKDLNKDLQDPNTPIWNDDKINEVCNFFRSLPEDENYFKFLFYWKIQLSNYHEPKGPALYKLAGFIAKDLISFFKQEEVSNIVQISNTKEFLQKYPHFDW